MLRKILYIFTVDPKPDARATKKLAANLCTANPDEKERVRHLPDSHRLKAMQLDELDTVVFFGRVSDAAFGQYTSEAFCNRIADHLKDKKLSVKSLWLIDSEADPSQHLVQEITNKLAAAGFSELRVYAVPKPADMTADLEPLFQNPQNMFVANENLEIRRRRIEGGSAARRRLNSSSSDPVLPSAPVPSHHRTTSSSAGLMLKMDSPMDSTSDSGTLQRSHSSKASRRHSERGESRHKPQPTGAESPPVKAKNPSPAPSTASSSPAPSSSPSPSASPSGTGFIKVASPRRDSLGRTPPRHSVGEKDALAQKFLALSSVRLQELDQGAQTPRGDSPHTPRVDSPHAPRLDSSQSPRPVSPQRARPDAVQTKPLPPAPSEAREVKEQVPQASGPEMKLDKRRSSDSHIVVTVSPRQASSGSPRRTSGSPKSDSSKMSPPKAQPPTAANLIIHQNNLLMYLQNEIKRILTLLDTEKKRLQNHWLSFFMGSSIETIKNQMDTLDVLVKISSLDIFYQKVVDPTVITDRILHNSCTHTPAVVDLLTQVAPKTIGMRM